MLEKIKPWILPAALLVAVVFLAVKFSSANKAVTEAQAALERIQLKLNEVPVGDPVAQAKLDAALLQIEALNKLVTDLKKDLPKGSKTIYVQSGGTGAGTVGGTPRPPEPPAKPDEPAKPAVECLLAVGDKMEITVANAGIETPKGNLVFTGIASATRLSPEPKTELFKSELKYSTEFREREAEVMGWGAGVSLAAGKFGWALGPALAFPPVNIWVGNLETLFTINFGGDGQWVTTVNGFVRFK
jgi:hypothetical protein